MSILSEAKKNGYIWLYDSLTPLELLTVGETICIDLDIDCHKTSFCFTPIEVLIVDNDHTLGYARGIIFEKCVDGQYEHEVVLNYGHIPIIHLHESRLICP